MPRSIIVLLLALVSQPVAAADTASGSIRLGSETIPLTHAFAMPFSSGNPTAIDVVATSLPIDRALIADDGVINLHDVIALSEIPGNTVVHVSRLQQGFGMASFAVYGAPGRTSNIGKATLSVFEPGRISGQVAWSEDDKTLLLDFDLPVQDRVEIVVRGTPLPADGGEPGALVLAHLAALASGDFSSIESRLHPEARQTFTEMDEARREQALARVARTIPTDARIVGGSVDGDWARVNFDGSRDGKPFHGVAELLRVDGRWLVRRTRARS